MQIYPALDLREGRCVRLYQGDYAKETHYSDDPLNTAKNFLYQGARWLHIVDLDGAKNPAQQQINLLTQLVNALKVNIQVGGGLREEIQIKKLFDHGIQRVIIGSKAVNDPETTKSWLRTFGNERIALAVDVNIIDNETYVAVHGWQETSNKKLTDLLDFYAAANLQHILCTDISRDGTLTGPNIFLYQQLLAQFPDLKIQASGGISNLVDIQKLKALPVNGAIVGRALYENKFTLAEALAC